MNQEGEASTCSKRQYAGLSGIPRLSLPTQQSKTFWPLGGMNPGFAKVTVSTQVLLQSLCYRSSMTSMVWLRSIYRKRKTYERHWTTFVDKTPEKLGSSLQTPSPTNHSWKIQVRYEGSWLDLAAIVIDGIDLMSKILFVLLSQETICQSGHNHLGTFPGGSIFTYSRETISSHTPCSWTPSESIGNHTKHGSQDDIRFLPP